MSNLRWNASGQYLGQLGWWASKANSCRAESRKEKHQWSRKRKHEWVRIWRTRGKQRSCNSSELETVWISILGCRQPALTKMGKEKKGAIPPSIQRPGSITSLCFLEHTTCWPWRYASLLIVLRQKYTPLWHWHDGAGTEHKLFSKYHAPRWQVTESSLSRGRE